MLPQTYCANIQKKKQKKGFRKHQYTTLPLETTISWIGFSWKTMLKMFGCMTEKKSYGRVIIDGIIGTVRPDPEGHLEI